MAVFAPRMIVCSHARAPRLALVRRFAVALACLAIAAVPPRAALAAVPDSLSGATEVAPATLLFWNRPIVVLRAHAWDLTPEARVAAAKRRLDALPRDVAPDEIGFVSAEVSGHPGTLYEARGHSLFAVFDVDLDPTTDDRLDSASVRTLQALRDAIAARAEQHRPGVLLRGILRALISTLVLLVLLRFIFWFTGRLRARMSAAFGRRAPRVLTDNLARSIERTQRVILQALDWIVALGAIYAWLTFVLESFSYTAPWGHQLLGFLESVGKGLVLGVVDAIPGLFIVFVIFLFTRIVLRLLGVLFAEIERGAIKIPGIHPDTARATQQVVSIVGWIFALVMAYPHIPGSGTEAFKAIGVFSGLIITFGSSGLVSQVMAGLLVVYSRSLRERELIQMPTPGGTVVGVVEEVGLLATKVKTPLNEEVTIPNSVVMSTTVTNFSRLEAEIGAMISAQVGIGYDSPWRQVHAMLLLACERTSYVLKEPKPYVMQRAMGDFAVTYEVRAHIRNAATRFFAITELHANI